MRAGRLPQNLLILLYKIKNNEVLLILVNGGGVVSHIRHLIHRITLARIAWINSESMLTRFLCFLVPPHPLG